MAISKCNNGHFYDNSKFDSCPHCEQAPLKRRAIGEEMTRFEFSPNSSAPFDGTNAAAAAQQAIPRQVNLGAAAAADPKTVGIYSSSLGIDPVVGWLVCIKGGEKGRSYQLHAGRNFCGRDYKMAICLPDDALISRENHCSIIFEPKQIAFSLIRGTGESVWVNEQPLTDSMRLNGDEIIKIGSSELVFIPYCKIGRVWNED